MKDRWNQEFFWTLESDTWIQKERMYILDTDGISVLTQISGTTITTGTTTS